MKVKELIEILNKYNPDAEVINNDCFMSEFDRKEAKKYNISDDITEVEQDETKQFVRVW